MRVSISVALVIVGVGSVAAAAEMSGAQVAAVYQQCEQAAYAECGRTTIYCSSYRKSYVKICLVKNDVPPAYIEALLK